MPQLSHPPPELERSVMERKGLRRGEEIHFCCPFPQQHQNGDANPSARYNTRKRTWYCDVCRQGGGWQELCELLGISRPHSSKPKVTATYIYCDEEGNPLRRKLRFEPGFGGRAKSFSWEKPDGNGGWIKCQGDGNPKILYRSEELLAARENGRRILVTEGEKDTDRAAALGFIAVTNPEGAGKGKWKPGYSEQLEGLRVIIVADKDICGRTHAQAVAAGLNGVAASVRVMELPGKHVKDLSDWVAEEEQADRGNAEIRSALDELLEAAKPWEPSSTTPQPDDEIPYQSTRDGLIFLKSTKDGPVPVPLTNFTATIIGEVLRDDGAEVQHYFEIEAHHRHRTHRLTIAAAQYGGLSWVPRELGATAVIYAGYSIKDHTRAAIQLLSQKVRKRRVFTHLGWRRISDRWCYLHAGGAIGPDGPMAEVEVEPPGQLDRFILPSPPTGEEARGAIAASLRLLDLVPEDVSFPVFCSIWGVVLGEADFSLHLAGQTGQGKSELAALTQQHFGAGLDARHLPGSWSSTGNALEALAFSAKDAILVVDDFAPEGTTYDIQRLHKEAGRLLRAQGNRSGRNRLKPDGSLRPVKYPRGLVLSTGEDIPRAQSIRARLLVLDIPQGAMNWELLTACQADATAGRYAQSLAAFLRWMAPRYDEVRKRRAKRVPELRALALEGSHRRTPALLAELAFGLETFLGFTQATGALTDAEAKAIWERGWAALAKAALAQEEHLGGADPVARFFELLGSALASGRAHLANERGIPPAEPTTWGWREVLVGRDQEPQWHPRGEQIGWLTEEDLYLDPDASYRAAQQMATVETLGMTPRTLWKRISERGLLVSTDVARGRNVVRVVLQGARRPVLHLRPSSLLPSAEAAQSAHQAQKAPVAGPVPWVDCAQPDEETAHKTGPQTPESGADGPNGPIGPLLPDKGPTACGSSGPDEEVLRL